MNGHFLERIVRLFIDSKLTPLLILLLLLLGGVALVQTPREEDPQIPVPMMDVFVDVPGMSSLEVESRVSIPLEQQLAEIVGVKDVFSTSSHGRSMVTVVFHVDDDEEDAIVKVNSKLASVMPSLPPGASRPGVAVRSVNDVPVLTVTFWSPRYDAYTLHRVVAQVEEEVRAIPNVAATTIIGGPRRQLRIVLAPARMAAFRIDAPQVIGALHGANAEGQSGSFTQANKEYLVNVGGFLHTAADLERVVVGMVASQPVYLHDLATVIDGPEEPQSFVFSGPGVAAAHKGTTVPPSLSPGVTLTVAKRAGTNAVDVAAEVLAKLDTLKGSLLPSDVQMTVTRNSGDTAQEKADELLKHLLIAIGGVMLIVALFLGWRPSLAVFLAIPATLALTLFLFYQGGYTLNRITFFGLILSIGILVDDPIVDVENIIRHFQAAKGSGRSLLETTVTAVNEVRSPLLLASLAVIFAILPLAFVSGMLGAYTRLIPIAATLAMVVSVLMAFLVTPWSAYHLLKGAADQPASHDHQQDTWTTILYRRVMRPLITHPLYRWAFLGSVTVLFAGAVYLIVGGIVPVKMLPFDNVTEFQVIVDMREGTALERTAQATREISDYLATVPEITDYQLYIGTAAPYNFNGLMRRYFLRQGPHVADIHVNLLPKGERAADSHAIALRVRPAIQTIAQRFNARVTVAEMPPGTPVLQTLVAEVYGPQHEQQIATAERVRDVFATTPDVVDVGWSVQTPQPTYLFHVDKEKAALHGIPTQHVVQTLNATLGGMEVGLAHFPKEKTAVPLMIQLSRHERSSLQDLQELPLVSPTGVVVPLSEVVDIQATTAPPMIHRKNLRRVVYVTGDTVDNPITSMLALDTALAQIRTPASQEIPRFFIAPPPFTDALGIKWDGEWQTTYEFLSQVGIAFAVVLALIYLLVVGWFQSFRVPLVILAPIPLSLIGIVPAHALLGWVFGAPSLVGFIAGAGLVVRNSIILVDFAEQRRKEGLPIAEAIIEAGAVRFRPMLLTASAVVVGSAVILFDPMFQGLALSLMAGEIVATFLTRLAVPVLYCVSETVRPSQLLTSPSLIEAAVPS